MSQIRVSSSRAFVPRGNNNARGSCCSVSLRVCTSIIDFGNGNAPPEAMQAVIGCPAILLPLNASMAWCASCEDENSTTAAACPTRLHSKTKRNRIRAASVLEGQGQLYQWITLQGAVHSGIPKPSGKLAVQVWPKQNEVSASIVR